MADCATKDDIENLRTQDLEGIERIETRLLTEFRKWAAPINSRYRVFEVTGAALSERLSLVEERLTELEQRNESS